jgi:hypothetical protein
LAESTKEISSEQEDGWYPSHALQQGTDDVVNESRIVLQHSQGTTTSGKQIQATQQRKLRLAQEQTKDKHRDTSIGRTTIVLETAVTSHPERGITASTPGSQNAGTTPSKTVDSTNKMKIDAPSASSKKKVKKKRPRDEIDDIFGAL